MTDSAARLGAWGEEQAAKYLQRRGFQLIAMNYRCRMGEIDLICRKRNVLAFVEVKLRKNAAFAQAREQVTPAKQRRIRTTAQLFLASYPEYSGLDCRFDVVEVYAPEGRESRHVEINHLENAFW